MPNVLEGLTEMFFESEIKTRIKVMERALSNKNVVNAHLQTN